MQDTPNFLSKHHSLKVCRGQIFNYGLNNQTSPAYYLPSEMNEFISEMENLPGRFQYSHQSELVEHILDTRR
jgi:hypothetical protein